MSPPITVDTNKLKAVNEVLSLFAKGTVVEFQPGRGIVVTWINAFDKKITRRWQGDPNNEGRPTWFKDYPHGGTIKSALVQLVLWLQNKPVLRLSFWTYWAAEGAGIPWNVPGILKKAGYPAQDICLKCGLLMQPNVDWCGREGPRGVKCVSAIQPAFSGGVD